MGTLSDGIRSEAGWGGAQGLLRETPCTPLSLHNLQGLHVAEGQSPQTAQSPSHSLVHSFKSPSAGQTSGRKSQQPTFGCA